MRTLNKRQLSAERSAKFLLGTMFLMFLLVLAIALFASVSAASAQATQQAAKPEVVKIPERSVLYRLSLVRHAQAQWGVDAPVARLAAQVHQESRWISQAQSPVGAQGMTQFMPATANWLPKICPEVGTPDPWDADWSLRAMVCYDWWLYRHVKNTHNDCARWAMTKSAYNGGLGWVNRDRRLAAARGANAAVWFEHVELHSARSAAAKQENRKYVRRVLLVLEPAYIRAGWPGTAVCEVTI